MSWRRPSKWKIGWKKLWSVSTEGAAVERSRAARVGVWIGHAPSIMSLLPAASAQGPRGQLVDAHRYNRYPASPARPKIIRIFTLRLNARPKAHPAMIVPFQSTPGWCRMVRRLVTVDICVIRHRNLLPPDPLLWLLKRQSVPCHDLLIFHTHPVRQAAIVSP